MAEAQESIKSMQEAMARRRGKYSLPANIDTVHHDDMVKEGGDSTQSEQDDYQKQVNQGQGNEAPMGADAKGGLKDNGGEMQGMDNTGINGNTDAAMKEEMEMKSAEALTHSLGSANAPGLRGAVMASANAKLDNMKAMREKKMSAQPMSKAPMKY